MSAAGPMSQSKRQALMTLLEHFIGHASAVSRASARTTAGHQKYAASLQGWWAAARSMASVGRLPIAAEIAAMSPGLCGPHAISHATEMLDALRADSVRRI